MSPIANAIAGRMLPRSATTPWMPRSRDQFDVFIQSAGWRASRIQPPAASTGRKPSRKTPSEKRGHPHFVQPPRSCDSAIVSPAAAITP